MPSGTTTIALRAADARADVYRQEILDAAAGVFAESGFDGATVREIAARSGASVGSVYRAFGGKDLLYQKLLELHSTKLVEQTTEAARSDMSPQQIILEGARLTVTYFCEHTDYLKILLHQSHSWSPSRDSKHPHNHLLQNGTELLAAAIQRGSEVGAFRDVDAASYARLLIAIFREYFEQWLDHGQSRKPDDLVIELQDIFSRLLFN